MKLDEAIETFTEDFNHPTAHFMPELQEAEKLGIEALKRFRYARKHHLLITPTLLPGETEE